MYREARVGASAAPLRSVESLRGPEPRSWEVSERSRGEGGAPTTSDVVDVEELAALLARAGKLSVAQSVDLLLPVISALSAAHDAGAHDDRERKGARSGQFALGAVLYECLVGRPPFESNESQGARVYRRPRDIAPDLPRRLEAIIMRALREDPRERFASMRDFGAALLPYASRPVQLAHVAEFGPSITSRRGASRAVTRAPSRSRSDRGKLRSAYHGVSAWLTQRARRRRWMGWALAAAIGASLVAVMIARQETRSEEPPAATRAPVAPLSRRADAPASTPPRAHASDAMRPVTAHSGASSGAYQVDLSVEPRGAWIMLDRKAAGSGRLRRSFRADGRVHEVRVGAPGYKVRTLYFKDAPPPGTLALERRAK